MKNLCSGSQCGGFQFLLILDLWGIYFHAAVVFGLGKDFLFKSALGHCVQMIKFFTCLAAIPRSTDLILSSTSPILTRVSESCFSRSNLAVLTSSMRLSKALSHRSF